MNYEIQELEEFLKYLATAINNRADGVNYVPVFERVERELKTKLDSLSTLDRINAIATKQKPFGTVTQLAA